MTERDAFGGHGETVKAIREHRAWHDDITGAGADWEGSLHGRSVTCWKEAEYVRVLLATVDRLDAALDKIQGAIFGAYPADLNFSDRDRGFTRDEVEPHE